MRAEHERGAAGRFGPGLPRISDGQLLFLLHMLAHAKEPKEGGSRIAIIMNGSPLFTGDAGSGESEIRRFILENDLLEALIALPEQLFYNTGIATYVWVVTNRKAPARTRQGAAHRRHVVLGADAQEPRRQAPRDPAGTGPGHPEDPGRLQGRRHAHGRQGRQGGRGRRQQDLPHDPLRLPQDHRRASAAAQLPGEPRAHRPARRGERASRRWRSRRRRAPRARRSRPRAERSRRRSASCVRALPGTLFKDRSEFETRAGRRREEGRRQAAGPGQRRRSSPPSPSATRRPPSAATRTATPSPIPSCATPRACRSPRASRRSSSAR